MPVSSVCNNPLSNCRLWLGVPHVISSSAAFAWKKGQNLDVKLWLYSVPVINNLLLSYYLTESFLSASFSQCYFPLAGVSPLWDWTSLNQLGSSCSDFTLTGSQCGCLTAVWQPLKNCQIQLCLESNAAPRQQNPQLITNQIWFLCQEGVTRILQSGCMLTDKPMSHFYLHQ